jgi:hypothetical protein
VELIDVIKHLVHNVHWPSEVNKTEALEALERELGPVAEDAAEAVEHGAQDVEHAAATVASELSEKEVSGEGQGDLARAGSGSGDRVRPADQQASADKQDPDRLIFGDHAAGPLVPRPAL